MVSLTIRRTDDLNSAYAEIMDPFGIQNFGWIGSYRKLRTFSKEITKLSFYDLSTSKVAVVKDLKVDTQEAVFSSDYRLCAVIGVNREVKEHVQLISTTDFTMLTKFDCKSKNTEYMTFVSGNVGLLVCERHYSNSLYLYSLTGLLITEFQMPATFWQCRLIESTLFAVDVEMNLVMLDDVCLNPWMVRNVKSMLEDLSGVTRYKEFIDAHVTDVHRKKRSEFTRFRSFAGGEKDRCAASEGGQGRTARRIGSSAVKKLPRHRLQ